MRKTRLMIIATVALGASIAGALPAVAASTPGADVQARTVTAAATMPNVVGQSLWTALDELPPLGDISTVDATGADRIALLPTIWKVCTQTPAPGTELTPDTPITLGVVKTGETCP